MIRISRLPEPTRPSSKGWQRKNGNKFKYNEDFIVNALWKMQHEKCCYCEMKIPNVGHLKAVEHFVPKSIVKKLTNDWNNLLLACAQCNGKKSDKFPLKLFRMKYDEDESKVTVIYLKKAIDLKKGAPLLIDPSNDYPEKYLDFVCDIANFDLGLIIPKKNSKKGAFSIKTIGLYLDYYTNIHRDYIREKLLALFCMLTNAVDNKDKQSIELYKNNFTQIMRANYKLAGLTRSFVHNNKLDVNYNIEIPDL